MIRRASRLVLIVAITLGSAWTVWPATPAGAALRYSAIASTSGIRVLMSSPSIPVTTTPVDVTLPSAQAQVSTLRGNAAFAAMPYPGDGVAAVPGLASGALAGNLPFPTPSVPNFPTIESAQCPTNPGAGVDAHEVVLSASCDPTSAHARASSGLPPTSVSDAVPSGGGGYLASLATTTVDAKTGTVTATARSEVTGLSFGGGLVVIGPVVSTATVSRAPGAEPERSTDFAIGRISVAGNTVELGPHGLTVLGSSVTLPGAPSPTDAVNAALKNAGISLTAVAATQNADGVVGQGLEIDQLETLPQTGQPVLVKVVVGQSSAAVSVGGSADTDLTGTVIGPTSPLGTSTSSPGAASAPSTIGGAPVTGGSLPGGPAVAGGATPTLGGVEMPPVVAAAQPGAAAPQLRLAAARDAHLTGLSFYPILVLAALVVIGGATLARYVGVRLLWSS